ncbi:hypothetical protein GCM10007898_21720 [Dyella flagellata]|uniref:Uncharacterized protein n=1 Tax=Dyella flagellata TaxID=1867833 RepID=A0ABQ5XBD2_9GAMM|nr:hypothetical protein GCM10007898_21720 [Dyella flagellata]
MCEKRLAGAWKWIRLQQQHLSSSLQRRRQSPLDKHKSGRAPSAGQAKPAGLPAQVCKPSPPATIIDMRKYELR